MASASPSSFRLDLDLDLGLGAWERSARYSLAWSEADAAYRSAFVAPYSRAYREGSASYVGEHVPWLVLQWVCDVRELMAVRLWRAALRLEEDSALCMEVD